MKKAAPHGDDAVTNTRSKPLALVGLDLLMDKTMGRSGIVIGLLDGPVSIRHPAFAAQQFITTAGELSYNCDGHMNSACVHGTFIAGILVAARDSGAPAICPGCTLLVRPIFSGDSLTVFTSQAELASAIVECIDSGAKILNLSIGVPHTFILDNIELKDALDYAADRSVIVVAATG